MDDDHLPIETNDGKNHYRYKNYELNIFDVTTDKPIVGATVYLYNYNYPKLKTDLASKTDDEYKQIYEDIYTCKATEYSELVADGSEGGPFTEFQGVTDNDG